MNAPSSPPAVAPPIQALPVGYSLLWYEIRAVLGQGGFGITYLAHDTNLDQAVAIKEYLPQLFAARGDHYSIVPTSPTRAADFSWGLQRFLEEGRLLARFDHPAIVRVYSVFEANSTAYLVMRYEEGESLEALLKRENILAEPALRAILADLMAGLEVVHASGFIHRDVKPSNIYLRQDGGAVLLDFGAARQALSAQTQSVTTLVSPGYAPFEQYRSDGLAQGPWTDIYGLGATAYRAITGRAPPPAVDRSHHIMDGTGDHQPSLVTSAISSYSFSVLAAIDRALAFRAADRPASVAAWRALLDADEAVTAPPPGAPAVRPRLELDARPEAWATTERPTALIDSANTTPEFALIEATAARPQRRLLIAGLLLGCAIGIPYALHGDAREGVAVSAPKTAAASVIESFPHALETPQRAIENLLGTATTDLAALRLTTPATNNALDKYRAVLARDPANARAKAGLQKIVGRYLDLAAAAAHHEEFDSARDYLKRAQEVNPRDGRTRAAFEALARSESPVSIR